MAQTLTSTSVEPEYAVYDFFSPKQYGLYEVGGKSVAVALTRHAIPTVSSWTSQEIFSVGFKKNVPLGHFDVNGRFVANKPADKVDLCVIKFVPIRGNGFYAVINVADEYYSRLLNDGFARVNYYKNAAKSSVYRGVILRR
jgi:hypothetical protein